MELMHLLSRWIMGFLRHPPNYPPRSLPPTIMSQRFERFPPPVLTSSNQPFISYLPYGRLLHPVLFLDLQRTNLSSDSRTFPPTADHTFFFPPAESLPSVSDFILCFHLSLASLRSASGFRFE